MKRKGDKKVNPGEEYLYKLSLDPKFNEDLITERINLGIPQDGFTIDSNDFSNWLKTSGKDVVDITDVWNNISKKYKISSLFSSYLNDYLFFGKNRTHEKINIVARILPPTKQDFESIDFDMDAEKHLQLRNEPYARLIIFGNGRKSDVIKYIEKNWGEVENVLKQQGWTPRPVIRRTQFKERNKLIKELLQKTTSELQKIANSKNKIKTNIKYKDLLIQQILKNEGYNHISEGYIRKMNSSN